MLFLRCTWLTEHDTKLHYDLLSLHEVVVFHIRGVVTGRVGK